MASNNTRFLIIPEIELDGDHIVSVTNSSDEREEAGPITEQPGAPPTGGPPGSELMPGGDIKLTLSGVPEGPHRANTVRVTLPATIDEGRFGWLRDGDSALQMRQSMRVLGRLPAIVDYNDLSGSYPYSVRPRALALNNGNLLCAWMTSDNAPSNPSMGFAIKMATASADYTWSAITSPSPLGRHSPISLQIGGFGMDQYPDTDEIVLCQVENGVGMRSMYTHVSEDDGATWIERRRLYFTEDLVLSSGGFTDLNAIEDVDIQVLPNGRLVALVLTQSAAWSLVSNDRGRTWAVGALVEDWRLRGASTGPSASLATMRNGFVLGVIAREDIVALENTGEHFCYGTFDGQTWSSKADFTPNSGATSASVVMRPDGYPAVYTAIHQTTPAPLYRDWLAAQEGFVRDLDLNLAVTDFDGTRDAFHIIESAPAGALGNADFQGFEGLDTVLWRGQIVLLASVQVMDPGFISSSILLYRAFHWQPIQERLDDVNGDPGWSAQGHIYNRTWEPYAVAPYFGWVGVGVGTDAVADVTASADDGGYTDFITAANTRYYEDTSLTGTISGHGAALRFVVRAFSGGSTIADAIALRLVLSDHPLSIDVSFRLSYAAPNMRLEVFDNHAAVSLGLFVYVRSATPSLGNFIEVLATISSGRVLNVYCRQHDPAIDPEFDVPYDNPVLGKTLTTASGTTDSLQFGNLAVGTGSSHWKTVQLQRITGGDPSLVVQNIFFEDTDSAAVSSGVVPSAPSLVDSGLHNDMRTSQLTAVPSQYITGNVRATFRGEATLTGNYGYETAYSYERENLLDGPVAQEWRSSEDVAGLSDDIEILIDADPGAAPGAENLQYKPTGLAVFGRNWNTMRIQMNDTDSWGAPRVDVLYSTPNDPLSGSADRMTHMWSNDAALFTSTVAGRQLVCINTVTANGPWRAHQFRSQETGPWYYLMLIDTGGSDASNRKIYKILDNDEGKLTLDGDPGADGFSSGVNFDIFSDRFAVELGPRHSVLDTAYRYIKITIYGVNHRDDDEQFQRVGRFVLGYAHDMSGPMFDWGWSRNESSGSSIATGTNGVRYATRNHSPRRKFQARYRMLRAPLEADEVTGSPLTSWRNPGDSWFFGGGGSPKTWGHVVDILRRLEMDGRRAALVWDGDRAVDIGSTSDVVQTAADPMELLMVRVTNVGNMQHIGYEGQDKNLAGGTECKPTPMMQQTYTFEEDF